MPDGNSTFANSAQACVYNSEAYVAQFLDLVGLRSDVPSEEVGGLVEIAWVADKVPLVQENEMNAQETVDCAQREQRASLVRDTGCEGRIGVEGFACLHRHLRSSVGDYIAEAYFQVVGGG